MAGKRSRKTAATTPRPDNLARPTAWRLQHGGFNPPGYDTDPDTGAVVNHHRAVDTLGQMLANGTITQPMHDAGCRFRTQFRTAMLDGMRVSALIRVSGRSNDAPGERQEAARRRIAAALDLFGGTDSACGSCLWHVVGLEYSLREWATRQGWGGRRVHHVQAQGILVAALSVLAVHYGLLRSRAQPSAATAPPSVTISSAGSPGAGSKPQAR